MWLNMKSQIQNFFDFSFPKNLFQFHECTMQHLQISFQEDLEIKLLPIYDIFKEDFNINYIITERFDFTNDFWRTSQSEKRSQT